MPKKTNREIKFRCWNYKSKQMWENVGFHPHQAERHDDGSMTVSQFLDCPIMQFTGLKDKNGKEIYEGDILRVFDWGFNTKDKILGIAKVEWDEDVNGWDMEPNFTDGDRYDLFRGNYEIIGNIHETPQLLGDKQ